MTRIFIMIATALLLATFGCDGADAPEISSITTSDLSLPSEADSEAMGGRTIVVTSDDGAVEEEVVTFVGTLPEARESEEVEIPSIVLSALAEAPDTDGETGLPSNVSLIVSSDDGSVQEEVVIVDEIAVEERNEEANLTEGVLVASL